MILSLSPKKPAAEDARSIYTQTRERDLFLLILLLGSSAVSLIVAIALRNNLPAYVKTAMLAVGAGSSVTCAVYAGLEQTKRTSGTAQAIERIQHHELTDYIRHDAAYNQCLRQMEGQYRLAEIIARLPDPNAQQFFAQQFGVEALIPQPAPAPAIEVKAEPVKVQNNQPALAAQIAQSRRQHLDYTWLDQDFIIASKGVFGAKGSGKSYYLALEAWEFKKNHPDGILVIIDKHYDPQVGTSKDAFDKTLSLWFLGIPDELIRKYFVVSLLGDPDGKHKGREGFVQRIIEVFRVFRAELQRRQQPGSGGKSAPYFKIIFDEFAGTMEDIKQIAGAKAVEEIVSTIQFCEFECRKFNGRLTLGLHSLKKEVIGIDSNVLLGNMDLLFLGTALADPNTKFPSDIPVKQTLDAQQALGQSLEKGEGRAVSVRKQGQKIITQVLPDIEPLDLWFELEESGISQNSIADMATAAPAPPTINSTEKATKTTNYKPRDLDRPNPVEDLMKALKAWYQAQSEPPSDEALTAKWQELSGKSETLTSNALTYLREQLSK